jgi:hypothetical protein
VGAQPRSYFDFSVTANRGQQQRRDAPPALPWRYGAFFIAIALK